MPYALDQEALDSPSLKILDMNKPPVKAIPHESFPKMLYLHPKDKTKAHRTNIVKDEDEMNAAMDQGWKKEQHIPKSAPEDLSKDFEAPKRGPGRPKATEAA